MKKIFTSIALLLVCQAAFSQVTVTDSSHCSYDELYASFTGITPTDIGLYSDDDYSNLITFGPGFTFNFYGTPYTQFVVGENGMISFDPTLAGGYDPWPIDAPLLGNASAYNSICGPWCDIDGTVATQPIYYSIQGTAPNRSVAITWCGVYMFECNTQWTTTQIIMYETTNIVEVHIGHKDDCTTWNGGYAICGVQNTAMTAATVAPGRDYPDVWTVLASPYEAWRFTPTGGGTSYTVASIPYAPIPYASSSIYWYDSSTNTYLGAGDSIMVTPAITTTYAAGVLGCNDTEWGFVTVGPGTGTNISSFRGTNPTVCGKCDGTITLVGTFIATVQDTVTYTLDGVPQPPVYIFPSSDTIITLTGLCAGVYANIEAINGASCANIVGPLTLTNPPVTASFTFTQNLGCTGDSVYITNTSTPAGYTNYWIYSDGSPIDSVDTNPSHIFTTPGTDTITLVYSTYHSCYDTVKQTVTFDHILAAAFAATPDSVCLGTPINFVNTTVSNAGPTYSWNFGDYDTSALMSPVHIYTAGGVYNVTMVATDTLGCSATLNESVDVISIDIVAAQHSFIMCNPQDSTTLTVIPTTAGQYAGINYQWVPAAYGLGEPTAATTQFFDTSAPNLFNYTITGAITLPSGQICSSQDTIRVNSYNLIASYFPTYDTICAGLADNFNNMTEYYTLPNYTWTFNDGNSSNAINPTHTYNVGGVYNVVLTATDMNNCTSDTAINLYIVSIHTRTYTHDTNVCLAEPMPLTATVQVYPDAFYPLTQYMWTDVFSYSTFLTNTNDSITYFDGPAASPNSFYQYYFTAYYYIRNPNMMCSSIDTEDIYTYPPDTLRNVTQDTMIEYGSSVQLNADSAYYFWWTPDNGTISNPNINNPIASPRDSINVYTVYGMTKYGCRDSAKVTITVIPDAPPFIPSAFTPNGDGLNDLFIVKNIGFTKLVEMKIFNRWGNEIFTNTDPNKGWDGTWKGVPQDMGTYYYEILLSYPDGSQKSYSGNVTLIR